MVEVLIALGISAEVQDYFSVSFMVLPDEGLCFAYGDQVEVFGSRMHLVPIATGLWRSNDLNPALISHVFVASSAMEAICFLSLHQYLFTNLDQLLFVATGLIPSREQLAALAGQYKNQKYSLITGNSFIGRAADVRIAGWLKGKNLRVSHNGQDQVRVSSDGIDYLFSETAFNLNAFQVASGFRFQIRTYKSSLSDSFLDQLYLSHPAPLR